MIPDNRDTQDRLEGLFAQPDSELKPYHPTHATTVETQDFASLQRPEMTKYIEWQAHHHDGVVHNSGVNE